MSFRIPYGPNWYTAVMGTGVVAVALEALPFRVRGLTAAAMAFWIAGVVLLVAVTTVMLTQWRKDRTILRRQYDDPVMSPFYGAPAIGLMTVGAGAIAVGHVLIGLRGAVGVDAVLWTAGTLLGLWAAVAVPYRMITLHHIADDGATGGWLMAVVPPMVSAATGAALIPHLPPGQAQATMLLVCYAFFGLSTVAGLLVLNQLWQRMIRHGPLAPTTAPTVWIVLGFLGMSTTAVHQLGALAPTVLPTSGAALSSLTLAYGVPVWGFTMWWVVLAGALVARQIRAGLPYAPTWWSFTFPVGTVVIGTSALAATTGLDLFKVAAGLAMVALLAGWTAAALGTARALTHGVEPPAARVSPQPDMAENGRLDAPARKEVTDSVLIRRRHRSHGPRPVSRTP